MNKYVEKKINKLNEHIGFVYRETQNIISFYENGEPDDTVLDETDADRLNQLQMALQSLEEASDYIQYALEKEEIEPEEELAEEEE